MFTFSFGSAMAATTDNLATAQKYVDDAIKVAEGKVTLNAEYGTAAVEYAKEQGKLAGQLILSHLVGLSGYDIDTTDGMKAFKEEVAAWTLGGTTKVVGVADALKAFETSYEAYFKKVVSEKDYDATVADAVAQVKAIDTSVYSDKTCTVDGVDYTYATYADKLIKDACEWLQKEANVAKDPTGNRAYAATIKNYLYGAGGTKDAPVAGSLYAKLKDLLTKTQEAELEGGKVIDADYAKATVAYKLKVELYNEWKAEAGKSGAKYAKITKIEGIDDLYNPTDDIVLDVKVADADKLTADEAAKINEVINGIFTKVIDVTNVYFDETEVTSVGKGGEIAAALNELLTANPTEKVINAALVAVDKYEAAEKKAANKKDALMFDGSEKYDAAEIDAALAKDKTDIYANFYNAQWTPKDYLGKVISIVDPVANAIADATDKWIPAVITSGDNKTAEADKIFCRNYYDEAYFGADYDEIASDAKDALFEAKTIEEVNAIMADAEKKLAELRTAKEYADMDQAKNIKYQQAIKNYADQVMKDKILSTDDYKATSFEDIVKEYVGDQADKFNRADWAGKLEFAKNMDEVKALYEEAKAAIDKIMPAKEMKAEATKVAEMIAKLPASATVANEEQFQTVYDAYKAYLDIPGARNTDVLGYLVFVSKMNTLQTAQEKAVNDAVKALPKTITLADKEAVEAAAALYSKYADYYDGDDIVGEFMAKPQALKNAEDAIYNAEITNVKKMILRLTDASTQEEVAAARAAYEALSGSQQRAVRAGLGEYAYKLDKFEELTIKAVESLKIKASSTAKKGSITVKWTVKGDKTAVDGYQVYKSTKAQKGYKKAITTKKTSFKNTKNLKKGVRYFYKVRAYKVVDGKTYYSDWSNKANRIAK